MRLVPPTIRQLLIVCCPSVLPTFHVIGVRRWVHVELCEDGLWIYVSGEQRGLYRVMESLFKTSRIELPSIRIPHYLLRKWQKGRMHCHVLVNLNSLTGVSQNKEKKINNRYKSIHVLKWLQPLLSERAPPSFCQTKWIFCTSISTKPNLRVPCLILPKSATKCGKPICFIHKTGKQTFPL